jgi:phospholipid/cholesterol/gamma-HCH transport system substrate-binding protein
MNRIKTETVVGLFLLVGLVAVALLAVKLGGVGDFDSDHYVLKARFTSSSGLKVGSDVEVAGVVVGKVKQITLDPDEYESVVEISLPNSVDVQEDAIASVRSTGLIGGKFIKISPGGADELLKVGDEIAETESAVNLEELIGKYMFNSNTGE